MQQLAWRGCYELMAGRLKRPEWAFMNYGFASDPTARTALRLEPSDEPDRLCIQLYDHVVGASELISRDILEVGSGRGGGASYLSRYRAPRSMTGMDLAQRAVELSRRHRRGPGLRFVQGDAQALPFPDDAFDLVVNVESSHCYASMTAFVAEVARVLKPAGSFAYADFRPAAEVPHLRACLSEGPLVLTSSEDITANVLEALRADSDRKSELIDMIVPRLFRRPFRRFAGIRTSSTFEKFESGELRYICAHLVAPDS
jgi:SAM-dependent methyltransferase